MRKNIGTVGQTIRILVGLILLSLLFILQGNFRFIGLLGIVFLVTGILGICPVCCMFGNKSCACKVKH